MPMQTRIVTRTGTIKYNGNEFIPDTDILLAIVGAGKPVLVMEDAFPEAIIVHSQSKEFLCNAYTPGFFDHDHDHEERES